MVGQTVQKELERQLDILSNHIVEITPYDEFVEKLKWSIETKTPLRVKYGIDPTVESVHVGHLVPCRKMRQFQDLGHIGVVVIGDYTAQIGDPSGKNATRPKLDAETVKQNARSYMDQMYTVLDPKRTEVRYQSEWFSKVTLADILEWAGSTTVAKLLTHDTFKKRLEENQPLALHELFYPMLQGVDSVYLESDVELGGSDQRFNVLMGRDYQRAKGMATQVAMLLPIILGTCGVNKMSKSLGNFIGIHDAPFDMFGKIMSIPDALMVDYYKYVSSFDVMKIRQVQDDLANGKLHPNIAKKDLAENVVSFFHGNEMGPKMRSEFESVFSKKQIPDEVEEFVFKVGELLVDVLVKAGVCPSKSDVRRLIQQNAVSFTEGDKVTDNNFVLAEDHRQQVLKIGKRKFLRLV